jgi:hypothetical protein
MKNLGRMGIACIIAMSLVVAFGSVALASPTAANIDSGTSARPQLAIKAPNTAWLGVPLSIYVFEKTSGKMVPGAALWALPATALAANTTKSADYASLAARLGYLLGYSDRAGEVRCRFTAVDDYVLVAIKDGYIPGLAKISVKKPVLMYIKAPASAPVGRPVTISVIDTNSGRPVGAAAVYGININKLPPVTSASPDWEKLAKTYGFYINLTNRSGQVTYTFRESGRYILVALKDGYLPETARIGIVAPALSVARNVTP